MTILSYQELAWWIIFGLLPMLLYPFLCKETKTVGLNSTLHNCNKILLFLSSNFSQQNIPFALLTICIHLLTFCYLCTNHQDPRYFVVNINLPLHESYQSAYSHIFHSKLCQFFAPSLPNQILWLCTISICHIICMTTCPSTYTKVETKQFHNLDH